MLTTRPVRAAAMQQVGLAGQKRRNLQHVGDFGRRRRLAGSWMSVRIGTFSRDLIAARMRRPSSRPGPRNERPEVRLALSYDALKMNGTPQAAGDVDELRGEIRRVLFAFDDAGTGDEHERMAVAEDDVPDLD